jgi:hypothetical protein
MRGASPQSSAKAPVGDLKPPPRKATPEDQNPSIYSYSTAISQSRSTRLSRSCSQPKTPSISCDLQVTGQLTIAARARQDDPSCCCHCPTWRSQACSPSETRVSPRQTTTSFAAATPTPPAANIPAAHQPAAPSSPSSCADQGQPQLGYRRIDGKPTTRRIRVLGATAPCTTRPSSRVGAADDDLEEQPAWPEPYVLIGGVRPHRGVGVDRA